MNKMSRFLFVAFLMGTLAIGGVASAASADIEPAFFTQEVNHSEQVDGGWTVNEGRVKLNKHVRNVFAKAVEKLLGCEYEAVALLGTRVVSGTNYCILCRPTPVVPDAVSHWGLAYIYEDLDGNVSLMEVKDLELGI